MIIKSFLKIPITYSVIIIHQIQALNIVEIASGERAVNGKAAQLIFKHNRKVALVLGFSMATDFSLGVKLDMWVSGRSFHYFTNGWDPSYLLPPFTSPYSDSGLDYVIKTLKEARTISFFEGGWTARHIPHIAQISHQFAIRKCIANGFFGENASPGVYHPSVLFQAPRSKRNIS